MNKATPKLMSDKIGITDLQVIDKNGKKGRWVLKLFDTETGEIFEESSYTIRPYKQVDPLPRFAKCEEDALSFRSLTDMKFTRSDNKFFGDLQALSEHHGDSILKQILSLTKHVKVHNVAFIHRDILCEVLDCTNANLNRKLNSLVKRNLIKYETKSVCTLKTVKILINPFTFWFGSYTARMNEWLSYWCAKSDGVIEYESNTILNVTPSDIDGAIDYDISYDIGVFDDSREYIGDKEYLMGESTKDYLTEDQLIYLIYGV